MQRTFEAVCARHAPHFLGPAPERWYLPSSPLAELFVESEYFEASEHHGYSWDWPHTAESFADYLRTISDFRLLEPTAREALIAALSDCIAAHGGNLALPMETHLYVAQRRA